MTSIERESAAIERMKMEAELTQLRFENKWLRDANKALSTALDEVRKPLPPEAFT